MPTAGRGGWSASLGRGLLSSSPHPSRLRLLTTDRPKRNTARLRAVVYAAASSVPGYVSSQTAQPALPETEVLRNRLETGLLSQPRWLHQPPAFSLDYCSKPGAGPIAGIDSSDGLLTFSKQHGAITSPPRPSPATTRRMQLPALHPAHYRSRDHPLAACVRVDAVAQHRRVAAHAISSASSPSALVQRA